VPPPTPRLAILQSNPWHNGRDDACALSPHFFETLRVSESAAVRRTTCVTATLSPPCRPVPSSVNAYGHYQRVLLSTAVTSALRLNQRLPRIQLSRTFLSGLVGEDSFHYLCFAFMFLNMSAAVSRILSLSRASALLLPAGWHYIAAYGIPAAFVTQQ